MSSQAVEIEILGRTIKVNCPVGQETALRAAAADFDSRLNELSQRTKISNPEQLLMFTGLNICSELHNERKEFNTNADSLSERIGQLTETLTEALQNQPQR
ncbi:MULTISPECIES: cell division protein ZapA [Photobacterium]|uniref:Cell division protein ZapA n=1 Tax=Photobacterium halotolerans TaxID=265726 RepID=A0A0F5V7W9_9GAMM|nr:MULTISPECIES: cell division protein ZapA [Photobacterium]KKC98218.1 Z-ring-associated protein [Photobacterium halotolerans]UIP28400.1 cell division protein ZapA [Photobacterium sp. TLY01]